MAVASMVESGQRGIDGGVGMAAVSIVALGRRQGYVDDGFGTVVTGWLH